MRPLGFIESYETFAKEIHSVLQKEQALGFLLDCPTSSRLEKSGLIDCHRSIEALNQLMTDRMSIYYLSPLRLIRDAGDGVRPGARSPQAKRQLVCQFNEQILSGLDIPFRVDFPCLLLFRPQGDRLTDRKYLYLNKDSCFYFGDLYQAISDYCAASGETSEERGSMLDQVRAGYKSIKEDLPKAVIAKTIEVALLGLGGLISNV
jgi:hypothetical protein